MVLFGTDHTTQLARIERKLDLILRQLEIDPDDPGEASDAIAQLARSGRKIEAIKEYRQATGVGLKEAKEYVDRLVDGL